jgi:prepilin peptidase CpaA
MHFFPIACLLLLLISAAWHDIRSRRIPNNLVLTGIIAGLLLNALLPETMGGRGITSSVTGLVVGFLLLLPFYLLRAMGAGDIKLIAMTGAFLGPHATFGAFLYILGAGGVLALSAGCRKGKLGALFSNLKAIAIGRSTRNFCLPGNPLKSPEDSIGDLPYGLAIAAGTVAYLVASNSS